MTANLSNFRRALASKYPGLEVIANIEVTLLSFKREKGTKGEYMVLDVTKPDGEVLQVKTSGYRVMDMIIAADEAHALPCQATFYKDGQAWDCK